MDYKTQEQIVEVMARAIAKEDDASGGSRYSAYWVDLARAALAALEEKGYAVVKEGRQAPFIAGSGIRHAQEPYTAEPGVPTPPEQT